MARIRRWSSFCPIKNGASTDNAIARFDGATGKIIQNSTAILEDDGRIALVTDPTFAQEGDPPDEKANFPGPVRRFPESIEELSA